MLRPNLNFFLSSRFFRISAQPSSSSSSAVTGFLVILGAPFGLSTIRKVGFDCCELCGLDAMVGIGGGISLLRKAWRVADEVILIDLPAFSAPFCTGLYREGWPILLRSLGAMEGVYPAPGPAPAMFKPDGAYVAGIALLGRCAPGEALQFGGGFIIVIARP